MPERDSSPGSKLRLLEANSAAVLGDFHLIRLNGFGAVNGGALRDPELGRYHLESVWFTLLFVPAFLVGVYLASNPVVDGKANPKLVAIHRKVSLNGLGKAYGGSWVWRIIGASAWKYCKSAAWIVSAMAILVVIALPFVHWLQSGGGKP